MQYTRLGNTGLTVSRLALGCMSFGDRSWQPWLLDEEASQPFFRRAIELGINFFDTADIYSNGVSEEITGRALKRYGNMNEIVLASKVFFPLRDAPNSGGLSRKNIVQSCEASLRRLGVETIDLYQIHRYDVNTPIDETLAALDLLVRDGKVRYVGASSMYAWQLARMLGTAVLNGWTRFVSMQNHYNLLYREEERGMIPLCQEEGLAVLPWSPLARGLLARAESLEDPLSTARAKSDELMHERYTAPEDAHVIRALRQLADERGEPPAEIAMAWLLSKSGVTAPIVGVSKISHLESAVRSLSLELSAEEVALLEAPYVPHRILGH
ncbi:MAG: aldo/keto reductase [Bacteroidetes bacterium]|nr:aldo/keto reductase [Bacteroidota bacterium]MDE2671652.1 aldo/keto reductase [Bacteroidota bacterium]